MWVCARASWARRELTVGPGNGRGGGRPGQEAERVGPGHRATVGPRQISGPLRASLSLCTVDKLRALPLGVLGAPRCVSVGGHGLGGGEKKHGGLGARWLCSGPLSAHCVLHISLQLPVGAVCVGESPAVNFENSYFCLWQRRPVRTCQHVDERDGWGGCGAVRGFQELVTELHPCCRGC